jgi:hypothetical protein
LRVATLHTWVQCKFNICFLRRKKHTSQQLILLGENEAPAQIETQEINLGKRKEQILSEHGEPEAKKLKKHNSPLKLLLKGFNTETLITVLDTFIL